MDITNMILRMYDAINEFKYDKDITEERKFEELFLLICDVIDYLGKYDKDKIKDIINMLNEYDFEKNRDD